MDLTEFNKAVGIARHYFALQGLDDEDTTYSIGKHVCDLFQEGETRPLMLANRAIDRMLLQLDAELEIQAEQLYVVFNKA